MARYDATSPADGTGGAPDGRGRGLDRLLDASIVGGFSRIGYDVRSRILPQFAAPLPAMTGKTVLLTGATSGIGLAAGIRLASLGARVCFLARNRDKARRAHHQIAVAAAAAGHDPDAVSYQLADLDDLASVRGFAGAFTSVNPRLDVLIHNAGAINERLRRAADGVELTAAAQLVAPFLLTNLLLGVLGAAAPARVITVSSGGMYAQRTDTGGLANPASDSYRGVTAYAKVKRAQVALNTQWAARTPAGRTAFHVMHPGWVRTPGITGALPGFAVLMRPLLRTPGQGADTMVWLAGADPAGLGSGRFWHDRAARPLNRALGAPPDPPDAGQRLWGWVAEQAGIDPRTAAEPRRGVAEPASADSFGAQGSAHP
jgi:dehydrogenase/reductase SDR family member 12